MLEAGEDPLYVARRLVRCASEDIGLADNAALPLVRILHERICMQALIVRKQAMSAYQACEKIGMPECDTILGLFLSVTFISRVLTQS